MANYDQQLRAFIKRHLPAVQRLEFHVEDANADRVILCAPLNANINDKLTAFGGSQQMLALTCAWSLVYVNLIEAGLAQQQFVVAEVTTKFNRPVRSDTFYAVSDREDTVFERFTAELRKGASPRIINKASIYDETTLHQRLNSQDSITQSAKSATNLQATFASIKG